MTTYKRPWRAYGFLVLDKDDNLVISAYDVPRSASQAIELVEFIAKAVNSYKGKLPSWMKHGHLCKLPIPDSNAG